jgi:hypothetical protein
MDTSMRRRSAGTHEMGIGVALVGGLGTAFDPEESRLVRGLNAALALRHAEDRVSRRERQALLELAAS